MGDQLDLHAVRIGEGENLLGAVEARSGALDEDTLVAQALLPVVDGALRDAEGGVGDLTGAGVSAAGVRPGEEGQDGAGRSGVVAEIEVVGAGVVEVDGALDEAKAEDLGVEVEVALRVRGDGGDVVKTDDGFEHVDGSFPGCRLLPHHKIRYRSKRFTSALTASVCGMRQSPLDGTKTVWERVRRKALTMTE